MPQIARTPRSLHSALVPGLLWGFAGDSITNGSSAGNFVYAYAPRAVAMAGGLVARRDSIEAGTPGERSAEVLARIGTLLGYGVQGVVLMIGTNDAGNAVPVSTYADNVTRIITACKRRNVSVVVCTVPPRASSTNAIYRLIHAYNTWIRLNVPAFGCEVADVYTELANAASGVMQAGYDSGDGTHPNAWGHCVMADVVARAMRRAAGWVDGTGLIESVWAGSANLIADPLMQRATPTTNPWFEWPGGTGTAPSYSMVSDASGVLPAGQWAEMDFTATSGGTRRLAVGTTDITSGDVVILTGHIQVQDISGTWFTNNAATTGTEVVTASCVNGDTGVLVTGSQVYTLNPGLLQEGTTDTYDLGPFVWPVTVPAGLTTLSFWFSVALPNGKHVKARLGCFGIIHATRLGLDSLVDWDSAMVNT